MTFINTAILKQPINWITVLLMVFIGSIALHLVLSHYQSLTADANQ